MFNPANELSILGVTEVFTPERALPDPNRLCITLLVRTQRNVLELIIIVCCPSGRECCTALACESLRTPLG